MFVNTRIQRRASGWPTVYNIGLLQNSTRRQCSTEWGWVCADFGFGDIVRHLLYLPDFCPVQKFAGAPVRHVPDTTFGCSPKLMKTKIKAG